MKQIANKRTGETQATKEEVKDGKWMTERQEEQVRHIGVGDRHKQTTNNEADMLCSRCTHNVLSSIQRVNHKVIHYINATSTEDTKEVIALLVLLVQVHQGEGHISGLYI